MLRRDAAARVAKTTPGLGQWHWAETNAVLCRMKEVEKADGSPTVSAGSETPASSAHTAKSKKVRGVQRCAALHRSPSLQHGPSVAYVCTRAPLPAKCRRRVLVRERQPFKGERILNHRRVRACKALNGFASSCQRASMSLCACRLDRLRSRKLWPHTGGLVCRAQ
jgi:hypothetical protein